MQKQVTGITGKWGVPDRTDRNEKGVILMYVHRGDSF